MVKDAEHRAKKYEKSIHPERIGRTLEAVKPIMVDQEKPYLANITMLERKIKALCERQGIPTIQIAQYINYGRQLYSKSKRFSQATLAAEAQYLTDLWTSRGLLGSKLVEIAALFGVTPSAAPTPSTITGWKLIRHGIFTDSVSIDGLNGDEEQPYLLIINAYHATDQLSVALGFNNQTFQYAHLVHYVSFNMGVPEHSFWTGGMNTANYIYFGAETQHGHQLCEALIAGISTAYRMVKTSSAGYSEVSTFETCEGMGTWGDNANNLTSIQIIVASSTKPITRGEYWLYKTEL